MIPCPRRGCRSRLLLAIIILSAIRVWQVGHGASKRELRPHAPIHSVAKAGGLVCGDPGIEGLGPSAQRGLVEPSSDKTSS
jgi:hypothetical protein